jgi:GDP-L-fucose synthase
VEGVDGKAPDETILKILDKYGIRVNSSLIRDPSCANSVSVEIWGSGAPLREFLWSGEMADACVYLMERVNFSDLIRENSSSIGIHSCTPEVRNTHINIGTGKELTIKELAYLIKEKAGFKGELVFNASKPDGTLRKLTDVSKRRSNLLLMNDCCRLLHSVRNDETTFRSGLLF